MGQARVLALTMIAAVLLPAPPRAQQPVAPIARDIELKPTNHPRVSLDASQLWLAPPRPRRRARTPRTISRRP